MIVSDAGYGFIGRVEDMISKNKAGKSYLSVPNGAQSMSPHRVEALDDQLIAAFTTEGRLLIFQAKELPELGRGKGNKLINIPSAALKNRTEFLGHVLIFSETDALTVYSGKRHITLTLKELTHYRGERARRGLKLPRGFQKVDRVELKR